VRVIHNIIQNEKIRLELQKLLSQNHTLVCNLPAKC
jgi:hypothetical protein